MKNKIKIKSGALRFREESARGRIELPIKAGTGRTVVAE